MKKALISIFCLFLVGCTNVPLPTSSSTPIANEWEYPKPSLHDSLYVRGKEKALWVKGFFADASFLPENLGEPSYTQLLDSPIPEPYHSGVQVYSMDGYDVILELTCLIKQQQKS